MLTKLFLTLSKILPRKNHPFNLDKNGILNLNYSEHEFITAPGLEELFSKGFNFENFRNSTVLDIGCGGGGKGVYFAQKYGCQIIGIDTEINFIEQAKIIAKEKKVDVLCKFELGDALNMNIQDNSIDYVILNDVVEHIPNTKKMFEEVYRVLKKGGYVLFNFAPYYEVFGHHLWDTLPIPWLHVFTTESFRIKLYKESVKDLPDGDKRIELRVGNDSSGRESFTYLNRITRKEYLDIRNNLFKNMKFEKVYEKHNMLKNLTILKFIPILNELFSRLYIGIWRKLED